MKVIQINDNGIIENHIRGCLQSDYTLCGTETKELDANTRTKEINANITCKDCLKIIKYCEQIKI